MSAYSDIEVAEMMKERAFLATCLQEERAACDAADALSAQLRAENARLREALVQFVQAYDTSSRLRVTDRKIENDRQRRLMVARDTARALLKLLPAREAGR